MSDTVNTKPRAQRIDPQAQSEEASTQVREVSESTDTTEIREAGPSTQPSPASEGPKFKTC